MARRDDWTAANETIDAGGLECPEPVLRVRRAFRERPAGWRVRIRATDPHATLDFEAFCVRGGHVLEHAATQDGDLWFQLRKG